jgi:hypothetical protein
MTFLRVYHGAQDKMSAAQIGSVVYRHTAGQFTGHLMLTADGSIARLRPNVKTHGQSVLISGKVTNITAVDAFELAE